MDAFVQTPICEEIGFDLLVFIYALNAGDLTCLEIDDVRLVVHPDRGVTHGSVEFASADAITFERPEPVGARTSPDREPV